MNWMTNWYEARAYLALGLFLNERSRCRYELGDFVYTYVYLLSCRINSKKLLMLGQGVKKYQQYTHSIDPNLRKTERINHVTFSKCKLAR